MGTWILLLSLWLTAGCGDKAEGTKTHAPLPPGPPTVSKEGDSKLIKKDLPDLKKLGNRARK